MMRARFAALLVLCFVAILLNGCNNVIQCKPDRVTEDLPKVGREFRAAWVASVSNINWPSKKGLSVEKQKQEAIAYLDMLEKYNFNAVVFQVRPQCDALYASELEPWSHYLTGKQGKAPVPFYDPLQFWIENAHKRGIELHAWFNPYRAHTGKSEPSSLSIVKRRPDLVKRLENGTYWLDPARKETQDYSYAVVMDVVKRYDVDGIHFDDYFYPYRSYNGGKDFPDDDSWNAYLKRDGRLSRNDWRRNAVNKFICRLYKGIKREKPYVKFGLSPFGIWRPGYPESISGLDQYNSLYADARLWINKGWVDYWSPQLYWPINKTRQSFPVLLGWWKQENKKDRHFWPGINVQKGSDECINQIMITRGMLPESPGTVHWNIDALRKKDNELAKDLIAGPYAKKTLVPTSPWLDTKPPAKPFVSLIPKEDGGIIEFCHSNSADVFRWVVYVKRGSSWRYHILNQNNRSYTVLNGDFSQIGVSAVDRVGNESEVEFVAFEK